MDESKRQQLLQAAAGLLSSSSDDDDASEDPHALIESESDGERRRRRRRREERRHDDEPRRRREDRSRRRSRRSRSRERERHKRRRRSSRRRSPSPSPPAAAPAAAPAPAAPAPPPRRRRRPRRTQEETELWVLAQTREWSARVRSERPGDERAWLGYAEWQEAAAAALLAAQQQQKRQRKGRPRRTVAAAVASTAAAVADKRLSVLAAGLERCPWSGRLLLASLGAYADAGGGGDEEEEAQGGGTTNSVLARWEQALSRRAVEAQAQDGFGPHLARPGADGTALRREWRRWAAEEADSPSPSSPEPSPCDDPHVSSAWPLWRAYLAQRHRSTSFSPASSRALHGRAIAALAAERRSRERDARRHRHRQIQQQQPASQSSPSSAAAAATRAAERLDEQLAQLVLCLARDELDAGCGEAALLRLQGAIEFCFLRPPSAAAAGAGFSEAALADFGEYWRSGAPRVGEAGGSGGWAAWRRHRQQQQRAAEAEVGAPVAPPPVAPASDAPAQEEDEQREEEEEPEAPVAGGTGGWTGWWPARALDETLSPPPPPPEEDDEGAAAPAPPPPPPPPPDQDEDDDDEEMELVVEMGVKIEEALEEARRSGLSSTHALALAKRERQADAKALLPPRSAADNAKEDDNDEDERAALQPTAADDAPCSLDLLLPTLRASPRTAAGARRLLLGALELLGLGPELAAAAPCEAGVVAAADEQGSSWAPSNAPAPACARVGDGTPRPWYLLPRREGDDDDTKNDPEAAAEDARWLFLVRLLSALCASPSAGSPCADSLAWPELGFALVHLHFRRPSLLRRQGPAAAAEAGRAAARALLSGRRDDHLLFAAFASAEARAAAAAAAAAEKQAASAAAPDPALVSKTARRALEQTLAAVCGRGSVGVAAAVALQHSRVLLGGDRPAAAAALTCALANLPYDPRAAAAAAKEGRAYPDEGGDAGAGAASRALDACLERAAQRGGQLAGSEDEAVIAASAALAELTSPEGPAAACAVFERAAAAAAVASPPEARAACARWERLAVWHARAAWRGCSSGDASALTLALLQLYPCNARLWRLLLLQARAGQRGEAVLAAATRRLPGRADLWLLRLQGLPGGDEKKRLILERALRACRGGAADRLALAIEDDEEDLEEEQEWRPSRAALAVQQRLAPDDWAMQHGGGLAGAGEIATLWGRLLRLEEEQEGETGAGAGAPPQDDGDEDAQRHRQRLASARRAALGAVTDCPGNKALWLRALELLARRGASSGRELQALVDGARAAVVGGGGEGRQEDATQAAAVGCRSRVRVRTDVVSVIAESALA